MNNRGDKKVNFNGELFRVLNEHSNERFIAIAHETWNKIEDPNVFPLLEEMSSAPENCLSVSAWNPFSEIYGWPAAATSCTCLRSMDFMLFVKKFHKNAFINTPWPTSRALLLDRWAFGRLIDAGDEFGLREWLQFFPISSHYIAAFSLDLSAPQNFTSLEGPGIYKRFIDGQLANFTNGVIPRLLGESTRAAWLEHRASQVGSSYIHAENPEKVIRKIKNLRGVQIEDSLCCSIVVQGKPTMFLTPVEALALGSQRNNSTASTH